MPFPNPGRPTTWKWLTLHEHPVEPPGRRAPASPMLYLLLTLLGLGVFVGALYLIEAFGWFGT